MKGGGGGGRWEGPTQGCSSLPPLGAERGIRRSSVTEFLEMGGGGRGVGIPEKRARGGDPREEGGTEIPERRRGGGGD